MKILVDCDLWDNPKLYRLSRLLGVNLTATGGHLVRLWAQVARFKPQGDLDLWDARAISRAAGWLRNHDKFVAALVETGWLDGTQVHDWREHQGKYLDKFAAEKERKTAWREAQKGAKGRAPMPCQAMPLPCQAMPIAPNSQEGAPNSQEGTPKNFELSAAGLAQRWCFECLSASTSDRDVYRVTEVFEGLISDGVKPEEIQAKLLPGVRKKTWHLWEFVKLFRPPENGARRTPEQLLAEMRKIREAKRAKEVAK